jgi:carbon-monoxide dehydrogenase medium subunit
MIEREDDEATEYVAPATVDEAVASLAEHGDDAKLVAGGQSLLVFMRQGLLDPRVLIGLKQIPELRRFDETDDGLSIGAMVTQEAIEHSDLIRARFPALAEAAAAVASPLIRRQGTIGGNLCHGDPTGDPPAALIALGSAVEIAGPTGRRRIAVEDLFADYMETTLDAGEILVAVHLPAPASHAGSAYLKHRIRAVDTALVGVAVGIELAADLESCVDCRIGLVGAGVTPMRARQAETALRGNAVSDDAIAAAAQIAREECEPLDDTEGSEWYRREMIAVHIERAARVALSRARGN